VFEGKVAALDSSTDGGVFGAIGDVSLIGAAGAAWTLFARRRPATMSTAVLPPLLTFLAVDKVIRLARPHPGLAHHLSAGAGHYTGESRFGLAAGPFRPENLVLAAR
jgi:hypothetical protein